MLLCECRYAECCYAECRYAECCYAECHYVECRYAECRYAECHGVNILSAQFGNSQITSVSIQVSISFTPH